MRYFKNIKTAINLDNDENADRKVCMANQLAFLRAERFYRKHLDKIAGRLGNKAYKFFQYGTEELGLHDGYLLSLSMGDGIGFPEGNYSHLRFGQTRSTVTLTALNYARTLLHVFTYKNLRKVIVDIPSAEPLWFTPGQTLGQIYTYEIVAASPLYLRNEWLLDSGGEITIEFKELIYRQSHIAHTDRPRKRRPVAK